jgi:hypothetical protein
MKTSGSAWKNGFMKIGGFSEKSRADKKTPLVRKRLFAESRRGPGQGAARLA